MPNQKTKKLTIWQSKADDGCTQHFENMWDSSQSQNIRDKAIFATDTIHPQVDIQPTWKCEIWVRDVDLQNPGLNKDSEGKPKILNT